MIQLIDINKIFTSKSDRFYALKNINLTIKKGEVVVIKGVSGSGKSTLLSIIASIMKPTSGELNIDGENIVSLSDIHSSEYRRKRVGFITQSFYLFDELSVEDNLLAPLIIRDLTMQEIDEKRESALSLANIVHKKKQKISTLSGGEKQRTIIARAIVNNPDIIICDEPTANLDKENSLIFIQTIKRLKSNDKTIIISTHDQLFEEQDFIDRVYQIKDGEM
ncbi:MAG: ABC transporter ATP-binding protein [Campylobacterota bacterium]|nr:ABC transporter ATP-binding protein [Campylobacterota bacterium]